MTRIQHSRLLVHEFGEVETSSNLEMAIIGHLLQKLKHAPKTLTSSKSIA